MDNYIRSRATNIDIEKIRQSCHVLRKYVETEIVYRPTETYHSNITSRLFDKYNLLMYPLPQFHELYREIQSLWIDVREEDSYYDPDDNYYIQSWVNFYEYDEYARWHGHMNLKSWHGFFCVDVENTKTSYRLPHRDDVVDVVGSDGTLVISKSDGDAHRTWPWHVKERPRITIAFDIIPSKKIDPLANKNHWIPI